MRNIYNAIFTFFLLTLCLDSNSQGFGQDWINHDQPYYKIKVVENGVYKISYDLLDAQTQDPRFFQAAKLQIWHRGVQQNLSVKSSADLLSEGDYLLFYGIKNNGEQDAQLYHPATEFYNPYTNLFSDTSAYFLTVSEAGPWKRMPYLNQDYDVATDSTAQFELINNYFNNYWQGGFEGDDPLKVVFQPGEGWTGNLGAELTESFSLPNYVMRSSQLDSSFFEVLMTCFNKRTFNPRIYLNDSLIASFSDTTGSESYPIIKARIALPSDLSKFIKDGKLQVRIKNAESDGLFLIFYSKISVSSKADFKNYSKASFVPASKSSFANLKQGSVFVAISDRNNAILLKDSIISGNHVLPVLPEKTKVFYSEKIDLVSSLIKVNFKDYNDLVAGDSLFLIVTNKKLISSSREYAAYRHTAFGGGYDTLVAEINQLTDLFCYGEKSPLAIRKFLNFIKSRNINAPDHLFIIGMGIQIDYFNEQRINPLNRAQFEDLVIPAGVPGGDYVFSIGLDGKVTTNGFHNLNFWYPTVSTGRISAKTDSVVRGYLEKAKEHELVAPNALWKRNVIHLSGGYQDNQPLEYNVQQSAAMKALLESSAQIIRRPFYGAKVTPFGRFISGSSKLIDVSTEVNNGVSLITFLGHSGRSLLDVSIGMASDGGFAYNNRGKYPMLYLNGCVIGNTFYDPQYNGYFEKSLVQDWVLTPKKGAILALSNSGTGYVNFLKRFIDNTYTTAFEDSLNFAKPVGEQVRLSQKRFLDVSGVSNAYIECLIQTNTLQGDPAIRLFTSAKPDYTPVCERISIRAFGNKRLTTLLDSFELLIPVKNLGVSSSASFNVSVKRSYANNTKSIQYPLQEFLPVNVNDTLHFKIKGSIPEAAGGNTFEITINPDDKLAESDMFNNMCSFTAYMPGVAMICLFPSKYSIVNKQPVSFVAQSTTTTITERDFYLEVDTSVYFNSAFKKGYFTKAFNLPKWNDIKLLEDVNANDSIVYYWRVKYVSPLANEDTASSVSSFIYIGKSPEGWSQSEFPQFFEDEKRAIKLDETTGRWYFDRLSANLKLYTFGINSGKKILEDNFMSFQNVPLMYGTICNRYGYEGIFVLTVNPVDFSVRPAYEGEWGNLCNSFQSPILNKFTNLSPSNSLSYKKLDSTLNHLIRQGEMAVIMTVGDAKFSTWPDYLKTTFKTLYGSSRIDSLQDGDPYILVSRKGAGKLIEKFPVTSDPKSEILTLDTSLVSLGYAGTISSTMIGPATEWGNFFRSYKKLPEDSIIFNILGIDSSGHETILIKDVKEDNFSLSNIIDATIYPFLRLNAYNRTVTANTPQLLKWQVIYRKAPEGTLVFDQNSTNDYADFLKQEGDSSKKLTFVFKNISSEAFKPNLVVRYKITGSDKIITHFDTLKTALLSDSSWKYSFNVSTLGLAGNNTLEVFFNPPPGQKEEMLDNNRYTVNFEIEKDRTNPVLDVAFDGVKIMNGDIVAPSPTISIRVNDENKYLRIKDTTGLTVEISRPCGQPNCPFERINLAGSDVVFYPAGANNTFELKYKPSQLPDGVYTLRVQAKDATGNKSGTKPYIIQFEVVNEVSVSNFLPYPNPFSTRMWFVYTLTGDIPDQIRVQIFTITGKLVRSIFMEELGPLKIGTHKTDFVWDGTDDYGDQLANGLYVYKVGVRKNGDELKHRNTASDDMFKNGYGKLYILR